MTEDEYDALWRCAYCAHTYVVPSLARAHERKHEEEECPGEAATSRSVADASKER